MDILLTMHTFRDLSGTDVRDQFFALIEASPLFRVDAIRGEGDRRIPYAGTATQKATVWEQSDRLTLVHGEPEEVSISINVADEAMRRVTGSFLYLAANASLFRDPARLLALIELGNQLYSLLQPCYAFIELPGFPPLFGTVLPMRGLPGWGWTTWLGPEYRELVRLSSERGIKVVNLEDGGNLYLFPLPSDVTRLDAASAEAYEYVFQSLDPRLFQIHPPVVAPEMNEAQQKEKIGQYMALDLSRRKAGVVKVPRFRFRDVPET